MPFFICPNCGNRVQSGERTAGLSSRPKGCPKCGFGFLFELLDDYYPAPDAAFFTCDGKGRVLDVGRGGFELTGLKDEAVIGRPVKDVLGLEWIDAGDGVFSSLGLFETPEQGMESTKFVTTWIREEKLDTILPNEPKITSGKIVAHSDRVLVTA